MKFFNRYLAVATLATPLFLAGCMDKDVYDPTKVPPVPPVENPFGDDFYAPDGFDWSMVTTVKLNVEVKDEFNGQYNYLVEVFTSDPLNNVTAKPIAADVAKKGTNYTAEITVPQNLEKLYIRQTDPKQRKEVYEFATAENMNCKLYINNATTRAAAATRADAESVINDPNYTEPQVPAGAIELTDEAYQWGASLYDGKVYVINGSFTRTIMADKGTTIYVKGQYVSNNSITVGSNGSKLIILSGGSVNCGYLTTYIEASVQNFGTLTAQTATFQKNSELFNKGKITCTERLAMQGENGSATSLYNHGSIVAETLHTNENSILLNTKEGNITVNGKFEMVSSRLDNYGKIEAINTDKEYNNVYTKSIQVNQTTSSIINNYKDAIIEATTINGGAAINNYGTMKLNTCLSNNSGNTLYNNCMLIVTEKLNYRLITLDNGAITGAQNGTEWQPVSTFSVDNNAEVTLKNGSIILANEFISGNPSTFSGEGDGISMIKANTTRYIGDTNFNNLALELGAETKPDNITVNKNNCSSAAPAASKYTVETCGGIINEGNEGLPPSEPVIPPVGDATVYTYAFEDQWPAYGDFDMNDVVVTIDDRNLTTQDKKLSIKGHIRAVGAGRQIGVGIRFLNTSANGVTLDKVDTQSGAPFESGQSDPVIIICDNAHKYCKEGIDDTDFTFYCTDPSVDSKYNTGDGADFEIRMIFPNAEEAAKAMDIKNLDVFIISRPATGSVKRTEVHIAGYAPTDLATTAYFDTSNDASSTKGHYLSTDGLAWGICIPGSASWNWPKEKAMITNVYPEFADWIKSGGKESSQWTSNSTEETFIRSYKK